MNIYFFGLLFLLIISKIETAPYSDSLEIVAQFNIIQFKINSNKIVNCSNCMPAGIKLSKNGTIFCSFPRWYDNVTATFAKYNPQEKVFEPWPSLEENQRYLKNSSSGINSVLGFEIDMDDTLYILDQGKINGTAAKKGSIKLIHYSLETGEKLEEYIFNESIADLEASFLNDVVIDNKRERAYITDSGISTDGIVSHYKPGIIVLELENSPYAYRILTNHSSVFPDESFWLHVNNTKVHDDKPMMTGADGLALSCDASTLFYCPLSGRMIYSILTNEIDQAIKTGKFNEIKVYSAFKKEASDGLLASSQNNLYMTGIESGSIHVNMNTENDLLRFDVKDFISFEGNETTMWPDSLAIHDNYLYFVTNQLNNFPKNIDYDHPKNKKYNFAILRFSVGNDNSYIKGCSEFGDSWGIGTIIVFILFAIIILVVLSFVLMGSNNQEEVIDKHMNLQMKDE